MTTRERLNPLLAYNSGYTTEKIAAHPDTEKLSDLGMDSLDLVELVMAIEDEMDVVIDDDQVDDMNDPSIGEIVQLVETKLRQKHLNLGGAGI